MNFGSILTYLETFKNRVPEKAKTIKMSKNLKKYP
jgi:hypothetical protein